MKKFFFILFIFVAGCTTAVPMDGFSPRNADEQAVFSIMKRYEKIVNSGRFEKVFQLFTEEGKPGMQKLVAEVKNREPEFINNELIFKFVRIHRLTFEGNQAYCEIERIITARDNPEGDHLVLVWRLRKVNGKWLIDKADRKKK